MSVSRTECKAITADIEAAVAAVLAKHGLKSENMRATYGESYSVKITAAPTDAPSTFARYAVMFDLDPALDGKSFFYGNESYTITGIAPKSWKRPVLATRRDGKVFKFPTSIAARTM